MAENTKSIVNSKKACEKRQKLANTNDKIKKTCGQSMELEYLIEIEKLKETVRSQKLEHSEKEAEWKDEKQLLLDNLSDERKKVNIFKVLRVLCLNPERRINLYMYESAGSNKQAYYLNVSFKTKANTLITTLTESEHLNCQIESLF